LQPASPLRQLTGHTALPATRRGDVPAFTAASERWYSIYRSRRDARLSWPSWLGYIIIEVVYLREDGHHPSTNRAQRRVTSFTQRK